MYHPETEDMLPRCAPKPSAALSQGNMSKPTVPEVSILFHPNGMQHQQPPQTTTPLSAGNKPSSYASWKKRCLPQVAYAADDQQQQPQMSSVYPMRQVATAPSRPADLYQPRRNSIGRATAADTPPTSIQSQNSTPNSNLAYAVKQAMLSTNSPKVEFVEPPSSARSSADNVLTICAGTQTVPETIKEECNYATKQDVREIMEFLHEIRTEQKRILQTMQEMTNKSPPPTSQALPIVRPQIADACTQCDFIATHSTQYNGRMSPTPKRPLIKDYIRDDYSNESDSHRHIYHSPNNMVHRTPQQKGTARSNVVPMLPKPCTEQSLVMNELALKYLPSDKLSDLLHEIRISSADDPELANSPLRNIENMSKNPNDISSASYKYLKKYRLLPEETNSNESPKNRARDYDQQQRYVDSPRENHLDLDAIRRQPKFL